MAKNATNEDLRAALESHLAETEGHVGRLEQVFEMLDEKVRGKQCAGMAGIIEEGNQMLQEDLEDAVLDACIIAAGQRAEHYEMAAYGTSIAWAEALGLNDVAELLRETLEEEKAADEKLSALAEGNINSEAAAGADSDDEESDDSENEEEEEDMPAASRQAAARRAGNGSAAKSAKRSASRR
jgi:ferritin-like metal-binding protein YciE